MGDYKRPRRLRCSLCFDPELFLAASSYRPTASDIFVSTYPKCGTTWMLQIVTLILRKGEHPDTFKDYFSSRPIIEIVGPQVVKDVPEPRCFETHMPFELVPFSADAKYIYVARYPTDCLVSFYNHTKLFPGYYFTEGTFDDFFEAFINGEVDYGDYFDNLLSWYEHRHEPNIFILTYEEMVADHRGTIIKVAKFLGEQYLRDLKEDDELLEQIVHKSSFTYMQGVINQMWNEIVIRPREIMNDSDMPDGIRRWAKVTSEAIDAGEKSAGQFLRASQGCTGKKIQLSPEQDKRLKEWFLKKTRGSDVMSLWKEKKLESAS